MSTCWLPTRPSQWTAGPSWRTAASWSDPDGVAPPHRGTAAASVYRPPKTTRIEDQDWLQTPPFSVSGCY
jgi:hypothetical protein